MSRLALEGHAYVSSHRPPVLGFGVVVYPPLPHSWIDHWFSRHAVPWSLRARLARLINIVDEEWQASAKPPEDGEP